MKKNKLAVGLLGIVALAGCAAFNIERVSVEDQTKPIEIILAFPGKTQAQLFSSVKSAIAESKAVDISDSDKDSGRIIGTFRLVGNGESESIDIRVDTKPGKVRLTYSNFKWTPLDARMGGEHGIIYKTELDEATTTAHYWSDKLMEYVTKHSASDKNW